MYGQLMWLRWWERLQRLYWLLLLYLLLQLLLLCLLLSALPHRAISPPLFE